MLDTPRGRWFLGEHGRRARRLDGAMLEEVVGRLQRSLRQPPALLARLHREIEDYPFLHSVARTVEVVPKPLFGVQLNITLLTS